MVNTPLDATALIVPFSIVNVEELLAVTEGLSVSRTTVP